MSVKASRKVRSATAIGPQTSVIGATVLAARVTSAVAQSLSTTAREMCQATSAAPTKPNLLVPAAALREQGVRRVQQRAPIVVACSPTEQVKVAVLQTINSCPFVVSPEDLRQPLQALAAADYPAVAERAACELLAAVEASHQAVFVEALALACARAAVRVGFSTVQTRRNAVAQTVEVIAEAPAGPALITQIDVNRGGEPALETEVAGVRDGSCVRLLNAFEKALEEEGVRTTQTRRKLTGGVCELAAAREFVGRKVTRKGAVSEAVPAKSPGSDRRRQRLNLQVRNTQQRSR